MGTERERTTTVMAKSFGGHKHFVFCKVCCFSICRRAFSSEIKNCGVDWPWTQNFNVMTTSPSLLPCDVMFLHAGKCMDHHQIAPVLLGEVALAGCTVLIPFFMHGSVLGQDCDGAHSLG